MGILCSCINNNSQRSNDIVSIPNGILLGIGNPLLDISSVVPPGFVEMQNLIPDTSTRSADSKMYKDLVQLLEKNYGVTYSAGGDVQNTFRAVHFIIGIPGVTTFMGAVGNDEYSEKLEKILSEDGVTVRYQKLSEYSTGTCIALITGETRTLVSDLEASEHFHYEYLSKPDNFAVIAAAQYYYLTGYFLAVNPETVIMVAQHAADNNKTFTMNLSAKFVTNLFTDQLLKYVDILFGNKNEATKYAELKGYPAADFDVIEIAKLLAALPKCNTKARIVIITQGPDFVVVVQGGKIMQFPVERLKDGLIKDTNGAGDAFVGGFLAYYIQNRRLEECVKCGIWTATQVIQQSGCNFPKGKVCPETVV